MNISKLIMTLMIAMGIGSSVQAYEFKQNLEPKKFSSSDDCGEEEEEDCEE